MSHPLIILRKCFWITNFFPCFFFFSLWLRNSYSFTWMSHSVLKTEMFSLQMKVFKVFVVDIQMYLWKYLTTPPFLLVLWLPKTCILWKRISLLATEEASCYPLPDIQGGGGVLVPASTPSASGPVYHLAYLSVAGRTVKGRVSLSEVPF